MKKFLSCDWGTSTFRLRLVDPDSQQVLSSVTSTQGIAETFSLYKQSNLGPNERQSFFCNFLSQQLAKMDVSITDPLNETPIILSGMASSSIGMIELPYKDLPFATDGHDLMLHALFHAQGGLGKIVVISGARTASDVLRGEETILVGCDVPNDEHERLYIFPGTHSKHITVKNGQAANFTTYMTGEVFDLMSKKSILSASVYKDGRGDENMLQQHFEEGVRLGSQSNLLSSLFTVRAKQLFKEATPQENYDYLSGLLIGFELSNIKDQNFLSISLVAGETLQQRYMHALKVIGLRKNIDCKNADEALIKGHSTIYHNLLQQ
jgi:2-dehydro-3-deoxygalactonokinase